MEFRFRLGQHYTESWFRLHSENMNPVTHKKTPSTPVSDRSGSKSVPIVRHGQRADARRNREAVLEAARERFGCEGLECQIEEVARAAGVGVGTVYRHFPNKEALLDALIEYRFQRISERAAEALEEDDPWEAFCGLLRWSAEYQAQDRALSELISQRPATARLSASKAGLHQRTQELIRRAQRSGQMRRDLVVEDVPTLMCALGAASGAHEESMTALNWERFLAIVLDGMRAPGANKLPKPKRPG